jgi:hypothetical protein
LTYRNLRTIKSVLELYMRNNQKQLNTILPGVVQSFDPATVTAEISLPITGFQLQDDGLDQEVPYPVLAEVPVAYPGGGWQESYELRNGDRVLVLFCQADITNWFLSDGREPVAPEYDELHGLSSAICLPVNLFPRRADKPAFDGANYVRKGDGNYNIEAGRVNLGSKGASSAACKASVQDPFNTQVAAQIDLLYNIFLPGVFPVLSPVQATGSSKVFIDD